MGSVILITILPPVGYKPKILDVSGLYLTNPFTQGSVARTSTKFLLLRFLISKRTNETYLLYLYEMKIYSTTHQYLKIKSISNNWLLQ